MTSEKTGLWEVGLSCSLLKYEHGRMEVFPWGEVLAGCKGCAHNKNASLKEIFIIRAP